METLTSEQIREWGAEVGNRGQLAQGPADDPAVRHIDNFMLQTTQIQATLEVAAQLADLRETLEPNRLTGLGRATQGGGK